MKRNLIAVIAIALPEILLAQAMEVKVRVLDADTRQPVSNVIVCAGFQHDTLSWKKGSISESVEAKTNARGEVELVGRTNCGEVFCAVKGANEYYCSQPVRVFGGKRTDDLPGMTRFATPKNWIAPKEVLIALRKIGDPIQLCVKRVLPREREGFHFDSADSQSYDLLLGDWLPPLGRGKVADIAFTHKRIDKGVVRTHNNGESLKHIGRDEVTLCFVGPDNGLVEYVTDPSETLRIRTAPENGYKPEHLIWAETDNDLKYTSNEDKNRNFAFRVRTKRNTKGEIIEAYYGKIYGNPKIDGGGSYLLRGVVFNYYINPKSLDRNLEWDCKNNGFKVKEPFYKLP